VRDGHDRYAPPRQAAHGVTMLARPYAAPLRWPVRRVHRAANGNPVFPTSFRSIRLVLADLVI
ncbi:hypothetical protein M3570_21320, partial [Bacillus subtilis]|nr:hypothetical protein [Bacillus subtilis]